jgi:23S rRNA pseudouridine1911/1915/1917 synthase
VGDKTMCVSKKDRYIENKKYINFNNNRDDNDNNDNINSDLDTMSKEAELKYNTVFEISNGDNYLSLLSIRLETGRKHQIRSQLSHINHPVVGDRLYHSPDQFHNNKIALHSYSLSFNHPISKEKVILHLLLHIILYYIYNDFTLCIYR